MKISLGLRAHLILNPSKTEIVYCEKKKKTKKKTKKKKQKKKNSVIVGRFNLRVLFLQVQ
jgi:hypothetical protein